MILSKFLKRFRLLILPMGVLAIISLATVSCSTKNDSGTSPKKTAPTEAQKKAAIEKMVARMPAFQLVTKEGKSLRVERTSDGGWSFSTPPSQSGYNYSSSTGTYTFVETSNSGSTIAVAASGFSSNSGGGGTLSAGSYTYDMQYTFCLSADEEAFDIGLFDSPFEGVSMVIGISGDLKALMEGDVDAESEDFADIFKAFAFYIVYDDEASGSYDIIDWITSSGDDPEDLNGNGFAVLFDIKNGQLFFSKEGNLTVSGGSINFSGTYFNVAGAFDADLDDVTYTEVSGSGALGCN